MSQVPVHARIILLTVLTLVLCWNLLPGDPWAWLPYSVAAADSSGVGGGTGSGGMMFSADDDESWALSLEVLASW